MAGGDSESRPVNSLNVRSVSQMCFANLIERSMLHTNAPSNYYNKLFSLFFFPKIYENISIAMPQLSGQYGWYTPEALVLLFEVSNSFLTLFFLNCSSTISQ